MQADHPGRAALTVTCAAFLTIAAFGNQWWVDHVVNDSGGTRRLASAFTPFPWRITDQPDSVALRVGPYVGLLVTLLLLYPLALGVARRAYDMGLVIGSIGAVFIAAGIGQLAYGVALWRAEALPADENWFTYTLTTASGHVGLWAAAVGLVGGLVAMFTVGHAHERQVADALAPWGGQDQPGIYDTQAMWIPTQPGGPMGDPAIAGAAMMTTASTGAAPTTAADGPPTTAMPVVEVPTTAVPAMAGAPSGEAAAVPGAGDTAGGATWASAASTSTASTSAVSRPTANLPAGVRASASRAGASAPPVRAARAAARDARRAASRGQRVKGEVTRARRWFR